MISKENKVPLRALPHFFSDAHRRKGTFVSLWSCKNQEHTVRWMVVVPKKTARKATARNAIKRAVYSAAETIERKTTLSALDRVIVVHSVPAKQENIEQDIINLLDKE